MTQRAEYRTFLTYSEERIDALGTILNERDLTMSFFNVWRYAKVETLSLGCFTQHEGQAATIISFALNNSKINVDQRLCLNLGGMKL
jgi:hypothetical protein